MKPFKSQSYLFLLASLSILSFSPIQAGTRQDITRDVKKALDGAIIPNSGETLAWADGVLTRNSDGSISYKSNDASYSSIIKNPEDIYKVSSQNSSVGEFFIKNYGINTSSNQDNYDSFNENFWELTSRGHSADLKMNITPAGMSGPHTLNFDSDGIAQTVTMPDGQVLTLEEFKRTNDYAAMSGNNDVGPSSKIENDFALASFIWQLKEKAHECKSPKAKLPKYFASLISSAKLYHAKEKKLNDLLIEKMVSIEEKSKDLSSNLNNDYQIESMNLQMEALNTGLNAITGLDYSSEDSLKKDADELNRMNIREKFLQDIIAAQVDNENDRVEFYESYLFLQEKIKESYEIAKNACGRIKTTEECIEDENGKQCTTKQENDPVKGSCETVEKYLPILENGPVFDYARLYFLEQVPSFELNERMDKLESVVVNMMELLPNGDSEGYDWKKPLWPGYEAVKKERDSQQIVCANPNPEIMDLEYKKIPLEVNDYVGAVLGGKSALDLFAKSKLLVNSDFKLNFTMEGVKYDEVKQLSNKSETRVQFTSFLKDPKTVELYQDFYITVFDLKDLPSDKVFESFLKNYYQADHMIGLSEQRSFYLSFMAKVVQETIDLDKAKLEELLAQKDELQQYIDKVKEQLEEQNKKNEEESKDSKGSSRVAIYRPTKTNNTGVNAIGSASSQKADDTQTSTIPRFVGQSRVKTSSNNTSYAGSNSSGNLGVKKSSASNSGDASSSGNSKYAASTKALRDKLDASTRKIQKLKSKIAKSNTKLSNLVSGTKSSNGNKQLSSMTSAMSAVAKDLIANNPQSTKSSLTNSLGSTPSYSGGKKIYTKSSTSSYSSSGRSSGYSSNSNYPGSSENSSEVSESSLSSEEAYNLNVAQREAEYDESSYNHHPLFDNLSKIYKDIGRKKLGILE